MNENQKQEIIKLFTEKEIAYAFKGVVFVFDQIPEKKLQNAIKNYAPIKSGEEVVLLYEYSAKEGFVLTTNSLYINQPTYRDKGASINEIALVSNISGFSWRKGKGLMNPDEFIDINVGSKTLTIFYLYGKQLMNALEKTVSILKSSGLAGTSSAAVQPAAQETAAVSSGSFKDEYEKGEKQGEELADKLFDVADKAKNALGKLGGLFGKK